MGLGRGATMRTYEQIKNEEFGFIHDNELPVIIQHNRLEPLLIRCGGCRFLAPAQDVAHLIEIIEADGRDYVRDVSFPWKGGNND